MLDKNIKVAWQGNADCERCGIRDLVLFAGLERKDFELIHRPIDDIEMDVGHVLYREGDEGDSLYTVRGGLLKLEQTQPNGGARIVRLLRQGDVGGLEASLHKPYRHSAAVLQKANLCRIPVPVVQRLNRHTPRLCQQLMQRWENGLSDADVWLSELATGSLKARVARLILMLCGQDPAEESFLLSRDDMAAILGVAKENVSRVVAEFRRLGLIENQGRHRVRVDHSALQALSKK